MALWTEDFEGKCFDGNFPKVNPNADIAFGPPVEANPNPGTARPQGTHPWDGTFTGKRMRQNAKSCATCAMELRHHSQILFDVTQATISTSTCKFVWIAMAPPVTAKALPTSGPTFEVTTSPSEIQLPAHSRTTRIHIVIE